MATQIIISYRYCILYLSIIVLLAVGGEGSREIRNINKNQLAATSRFMLTGVRGRQCPGIDCSSAEAEARAKPNRFCQLQGCGNCDTVSLPGKAFCGYKVVEEEDNRPDANCGGKKCSKKKPTPDEFCKSYKNCDKCSGTENDAVCTYVTVQPMMQFVDDFEEVDNCSEIPCKKQENEEDEECYEFKDVCGRCDPIYPDSDLGVCLYKPNEEDTDEATEEEDFVENE